MTEEFTIDKLFNGQPSDLPRPVHLALHVSGKKCVIEIDAPYHGDPAPDAPAGRLWGLWDHEVVEIFLVDEKGQYIEAEFGPHGHYLLLRLSGPRQIIEAELTMSYDAKISKNGWKGHAEFDLSGIQRIDRVNCFAIYGQNEKRRYLAWSRLPGKVPDFHQPDAFKHLT